MSTLTPQTEVKEGRYMGFSQEELTEEKTLYKNAVKALSKARVAGSGGMVTMISQNGKQVQYSAAEAEASLAKWRYELENAQAQLDGEYAPHTDRSVARFR